MDASHRQLSMRLSDPIDFLSILFISHIFFPSSPSFSGENQSRYHAGKWKFSVHDDISSGGNGDSECTYAAVWM